jgi:hypothetical protein
MSITIAQGFARQLTEQDMSHLIGSIMNTQQDYDLNSKGDHYLLVPPDYASHISPILSRAQEIMEDQSHPLPMCYSGDEKALFKRGVASLMAGKIPIKSPVLTSRV